MVLNLTKVVGINTFHAIDKIDSNGPGLECLEKETGSIERIGPTPANDTKSNLEMTPLILPSFELLK